MPTPRGALARAYRGQRQTRSFEKATTATTTLVSAKTGRTMFVTRITVANSGSPEDIYAFTLSPTFVLKVLAHFVVPANDTITLNFDPPVESWDLVVAIPAVPAGNYEITGDIIDV